MASADCWQGEYRLPRPTIVRLRFPREAEVLMKLRREERRSGQEVTVNWRFATAETPIPSILLGYQPQFGAGRPAAAPPTVPMLPKTMPVVVTQARL